MERPTYETLKQQTENDLRSRLNKKTPFLTRSLEYVFSRVFAAGLHLLYGFAWNLFRQMLVTEATEWWLKNYHAVIWGVNLQLGSYSNGSVYMTGTNGTLIPKDSILISSTGIEYTVLADTYISSGFASVNVQSRTIGTNTNIVDDTIQLFFTRPIDDINELIEQKQFTIVLNSVTGSFVTGDIMNNITRFGSCLIISSEIDEDIVTLEVISLQGEFITSDSVSSISFGEGIISVVSSTQLSINGGSDVEDTESLRNRIIHRIQYQSQVGNFEDYRLWTQQADAGVNKVWVKSSFPSAGFTTIIFNSRNSNPTPTQQMIDNVRNYVEQRRVVNGIVLYYGVTGMPADISISLKGKYVNLQSTITSNLTKTFLEECEPGQLLPVSRLRDSIEASGITNSDYNITSIDGDFTVNSDNILFNEFQVGYINSVNFTLV